MKPTPANVQQITEKDLAELISIEREGLTIEFKVALYPKEKLASEWAKDVTAFANTSGGCLILGIDEEGGIASAFPGIEIPDLDALTRQMQQSLTSNTDPAPFIRFHPVELSNKRKVLLVGVPQSRSAPHAVRGEHTLTFYKRTDAAVCERMTVNEIRNAILQSQSIEEQCRDHHQRACDSFSPPSDGYTAHLSLFPLPIGQERLDFADDKIRSHALQVGNLTKANGYRRLTFQGYLHSCENPPMTQLIDRHGAVSGAYFVDDKKPFNTIRLISPGWLLCRLAATIQSVFRFYGQVGISGPILAFASLRGCHGRCLYVSDFDVSKSITQGQLDFPPILFDTLPARAIASLQAWGQRLWQAGDLPTCPFYEWPSGNLVEPALERFRGTIM